MNSIVVVVQLGRSLYARDGQKSPAQHGVPYHDGAVVQGGESIPDRTGGRSSWMCPVAAVGPTGEIGAMEVVVVRRAAGVRRHARAVHCLMSGCVEVSPNVASVPEILPRCLRTAVVNAAHDGTERLTHGPPAHVDRGGGPAVVPATWRGVLVVELSAG